VICHSRPSFWRAKSGICGRSVMWDGNGLWRKDGVGRLGLGDVGDHWFAEDPRA